MKRLALRSRTSWAFFALFAASHLALADDDQRRPAVPLLPAYQQECGSCHVAFPPGMLPPDSWRRLMSTLPRHYGSDASLEATTVKELAAWLGANAGTYRMRESPPEDRITKSAWFMRTHDEVPPAAWKRPAVKSAANCTACHAQAARGDFNEHAVRIPR